MKRTKPSEFEVHLALHKLAVWFYSNEKSNALNYAIEYAKAGQIMLGDELRVQCLYVLNNITHWRGEDAREVRKTLKDFTR